MLFLHGHIKNRAWSCNQEASCRDRVKILWFQLITGDLPPYKRVEGKIVVECSNHHIAILKCERSILITFLAVAVSIPSDVEPMAPPAFAVMR